MGLDIQQLLGEDADALLNHTCTTISKDQLHLPNANFVDDVFAQTNRNTQTLMNLQSIYGNGRLANTGYMSILPVDQGIEHSGGASFAPNQHTLILKTLLNLLLREAAMLLLQLMEY